VVSDSFEGQVTRLDQKTRAFVVKESESSVLEFSYTSATMFDRRAAGVLQQPLGNFGDRLPFKLIDKVRVSWKMDGKKRVATQISLVE
jgi:hypothetical protein